MPAIRLPQLWIQASATLTQPAGHQAAGLRVIDSDPHHPNAGCFRGSRHGLIQCYLTDSSIIGTTSGVRRNPSMPWVRRMLLNRQRGAMENDEWLFFLVQSEALFIC